jgi:hypothetical protein
MEMASQFNAPLATLKGICHIGRVDPSANISVSNLEMIEKTTLEIEQVIAPLSKFYLNEESQGTSYSDEKVIDQ